MRKKSDKIGADAVQENAMGIGHNRVLDVKRLKHHVARTIQAKKDQKAAGMHTNGCMIEAAEELKMSKSSFALVVKCLMNPTPATRMQEVNEALVAYGDMPLFNDALLKELERLQEEQREREDNEKESEAA